MLDPLVTAGKTALNGLVYPIQYAIKRAIAVGNFLIGDIGQIAQIVAGQAKGVFDAFTRVVNNTINAGSLEGAWNAAVDGLLGAGPGQYPEHAAEPYDRSRSGCRPAGCTGTGEPLRSEHSYRALRCGPDDQGHPGHHAGSDAAVRSDQVGRFVGRGSPQGCGSVRRGCQQ